VAQAAVHHAAGDVAEVVVQHRGARPQSAQPLDQPLDLARRRTRRPPGHHDQLGSVLVGHRASLGLGTVLP
jgi:hypothetical protein